jgi:hypothetical protein
VTDQEIRIARTESLFRDVNERIAESAARFDADSAEFVCECSDQTCTDRVEATLDEYQEVRATGTRFPCGQATRTHASSTWSNAAAATPSWRRSTGSWPGSRGS